MKTLGKVLVSIVLGLGLVLAAGWAYLQGSLPTIEGEARAKGLSAKVEILRDSDGIPHVFAANPRDGWFAVGYVHAQDRLWQMEFQRRVGQGRLSEFLGEKAYDTDRLMRTLGIARVAASIVRKLDPETVASLEAYSAGVNAVLESDQVLPVEFHAFRIKPEPWKPADSVAWLLVMSWDLSGNWRSELSRLRYMTKLGRERAAEFMPAYPGDTATPLPDFGALYKELVPAASALLSISPLPEQAIGSNSWVVTGSRSASGLPLLANDPHLGLQAPALWYLVHVSSPKGNIVGGTLPGAPFIVLGRNDHVAWSMTTTGGDVQDLFIERMAPAQANAYLTPKGTAILEQREEKILVGSEERSIIVRASRHGPIISDVVASMAPLVPKGHVVALSWTALSEDNATVRAGLAWSYARNVREFQQALRDYHSPQQNLVFADREGHIGFMAPARVPIRRKDNEAMGRVPVPGWLAKYDWEGFVPFDKLPLSIDPASRRIVTANHKITAPGYKPFMSVDWYPPYRADRIEEMLAAQQAHTPATFAKMQADSKSRLAREMLAFARAAKPATQEGGQVQAMLANWQGEMTTDSAAALVFTAWYRELTRLVYADELGELFKDGWDQRAQFMISVMKNERGMQRWCDDVKTPARETCAMLTGKSFDLAAADLRTRFGGPGTWRWGIAHVAGSDHRPFGFFPGLKDYFNIAPETAGDGYTVNVGTFTIRDELRPYVNRHAASLRTIYDLSDLDGSMFMQSTGQSGNVFSPWYSNLAQRWAKVEYVTIPTDRGAIKVAHTLVLKP